MWFQILKKKGHLNHESHSDIVILHSVALLLVQHSAQCCSGLALCAATASGYQGMDMEYNTPGFF